MNIFTFAEVLFYRSLFIFWCSIAVQVIYQCKWIMSQLPIGGWKELESDPGLFTLLVEDFGVKGESLLSNAIV